MALQIKNVIGGPGINSVNSAADRVVIDVLTDGAVAAGDVVAWTTQITNDVPTVHAADTDTDDPAMVAGVATRAASSGQVVTIVRGGPALVNIGGTNQTAAGEVAIATTAAGVADGAVAAAGTIVGDTFGVFLGDEIGTTQQAVVDVRLG